MVYAASHLSLAALEGAAEDFVPVLAGVSDSHRLAAIAAEVFVCETGAGRLDGECASGTLPDPGPPLIDTTDSGRKFNVEIGKSGSVGIRKMKIFCLDLALLEFSAADSRHRTV